MAMPRFNLGGALIEGLQAGQADAMRRRQMDLEEARVRQQMEQAKADAEFQAQSRPLALLGSQLALNQQKLGLRGQIIGSGETGDDYLRGMELVKQYDLPTADLPEVRSTAWQTFKAPQAAPEAPKVGASWLPQSWMNGPGINLPAPEAPKPSLDLPQGAMVDPTDLQAVQVAAQRGLPLKDQARMRDADLRLAAQADELERRKAKDEYLRDYAEKNFELRRQGLDAATADRETRTYLARLGYGLDVERFGLAKKESERSAALGPKFTADQTNSATFGRRLEQALPYLDQAYKSFDPTSMQGSLAIAAAQKGGLASLASNPAAKSAATAELNILAAILRKESGAAISESEYASAGKIYFPRYGDTPELRAQKRRTLDVALSGLKTGAGPAWDATPAGEGPSAPKGPAPTASSIPTVSNQAQYDALPAGSQYKGPDGRILTKKAR